MDLLISGKPPLVNRARAAMASRLTTTAAHLTISAEAQAIEDRLRGWLGRPADDADARRATTTLRSARSPRSTRSWPRIEIPYEEWEVLYRQRLQVERDLRAGAMAEESVVGADAVPGAAGAVTSLDAVRRLLRTGAGALVDVAADERTVKALDRVSGTDWRWAARAASVAAAAARVVVGDQSQPPDVGRGEPLATQPVDEAPTTTPRPDAADAGVSRASAPRS